MNFRSWMLTNNVVYVLALIALFLIQDADAQNDCKGLFPVSEEMTAKAGETYQNPYRWGLINCKGSVVIPIAYSNAFDFTDGVAVVTNTNESLLVSQDERIVRLPGVRVRTSFGFGLAIGEVDGKIYTIDKGGKLLKYLFDANHCYTDPCFLSSFFENGYALVNTMDGLRFVSKDGGFLKIKSGESPGPFSDGVAVVEGENGFGVIDSTGNIIVPLNYEEAILDASEGMVVARDKSGATIYLDVKGKEILRVHFSYAGRFSEGLAEIESDGKWGFMDRQGKISIKPTFSAVKDFSEGLAAVQQNLKWGFVDPNGDFIIGPSFDLVERSFTRGLAYVRDDSCEGYIDRKGRWIWKRKI